MTVISNPPSNPTIYGVVAFQLVNNLLVTLVQRKILTQADRAELLNEVGNGLEPMSDPQNKAMKELLRAMSEMIPLASRQ